MTTSACWSLVSAGLGLFGSLVLAFSVNPFLSMLKTITEAQQLSLETLSDLNGDAIVFVALDNHLAHAASSTNHRVIGGAVFLAFGFAAQVASVLS
jgi:hypothetical protein